MRTLLHLKDYLWFSPTTVANLATSLPVPDRCPVESRNWFPSGELLVLRSRVDAGLDEQSSVVSCGNDVGDVLAVELEEPVDNRGTTIST